MQTARPPLRVVATEKEFLITDSGTQLVDGLSSWWTACHGYNHPHIQSAILQQTQVMPHVMLGGITHPQVERLCQRLNQLFPHPLNHIFLANTGSESVEIAMKMAIQSGIHQGRRPKSFIHFQHAYHGDTIYAMSVCDPEEGMHAIFGDTLPKQLMLPIPQTEEDFKQLETVILKRNAEIAGVIIEPLVQGAGGMKMHPPPILKRIATLCQKHRVCFIVDEIFTGFGRTGHLFAIHEADIIPDIVCISKALTGGTLPLAAVICQEKLYQTFLSNDPQKAFMHGPTYMGNALACAAANASLDLFAENQWQHQVKAISEQLCAGLTSLQSLGVVKEVRVKGAIGVVELDRPIGAHFNWFIERFLEKNVWLRPLGNIVYTTPCFTIRPQYLEQIIQSIHQTLSAWHPH